MSNINIFCYELFYGETNLNELLPLFNKIPCSFSLEINCVKLSVENLALDAILRKSSLENVFCLSKSVSFLNNCINPLAFKIKQYHQFAKSFNYK